MTKKKSGSMRWSSSIASSQISSLLMNQDHFLLECSRVLLSFLTIESLLWKNYSSKKIELNKGNSKELKKLHGSLLQKTREKALEKLPYLWLDYSSSFTLISSKGEPKSEIAGSLLKYQSLALISTRLPQSFKNSRKTSYLTCLILLTPFTNKVPRGSSLFLIF